MTVPARQLRSGFGTAPVFLTAISTILGAVLFLRFGYAVGNVGFLGVLAIILIGHLVTLPTAMAISEIATNQRVQGGGEYFILSRSFGISIGAAIGVALFLSQAISVAFYLLAFAEAFGPVYEYLNGRFDWGLQNPRLVSLPATAILAVLIIVRGANLGIQLLYLVVGVLFLSLLFFFLGALQYTGSASFTTLATGVPNPDPFFLVFAICFPAFTGMTAGVGLSGDLRDPRRSIPVGTLGATVLGMVMYIAVAYALAISRATAPEQLVENQLIMQDIAIWGPIIPIGLACATLSSALGSALVAPRTLQALASDQVLISPGINRWFSQGRGERNEPRNGTILVFAIAFIFVAFGDVNFVAQIISMIFMVTYGSICLISFLEHFAADPSYRPVFRSRWYISLLGAVMCLWLMFKMSTPYAVLSIALMLGLYLTISRLHPEKRGLASIFQGAIFQISRQLQVFLQKSKQVHSKDNWRPAAVCITSSSFERLDAFQLLRWLSHRYGFGTYIHYLNGYLSRATAQEAGEALERLVRLADVSESNIYIDTIVSPSYTTAVCQVVQLPGISGKENNMILFEYARGDAEGLGCIVENYPIVAASGFDAGILSVSGRRFGYQRELHVWITPGDYDNANLMILLAYIILGHPDWRRGIIKLFTIIPEEHLESGHERLSELVSSGRLPISRNHIEVIAHEASRDKKTIIGEKSRDADLIIIGFVGGMLRRRPNDVFDGYETVGNILFVNTTQEIELVEESEESEEVAEGATPLPAPGEGEAESPASPAAAELDRVRTEPPS